MATVMRHEECGSATASLRIPWVSGGMVQPACVWSSLARHSYADAKSVGTGSSEFEGSVGERQRSRGERQRGAG